MAEQYRKWYSSAMSYYDDIYEIAVDNHYLVTTEDAADAGIPPVELAKLAHRGKLDNLGRGLYRLSRWVPDDAYPYAEAVARMGKGAYLYGESVVALLGLAPTNPAYMFIAVPRRTRRKLPEGVRVKRARAEDTVVFYNGVASQHAKDAIRAAACSMPADRVRDAARRAKDEGYLLAEDLEDLEREMGGDAKTE